MHKYLQGLVFQQHAKGKAYAALTVSSHKFNQNFKCVVKLVHFFAEGFRTWSCCLLCLRRQTPSKNSQNPTAWRHREQRGKLYTSTQTQQKRGSVTSVSKFFSLHTSAPDSPCPLFLCLFSFSTLWLNLSLFLHASASLFVVSQKKEGEERKDQTLKTHPRPAGVSPKKLWYLILTIWTFSCLFLDSSDILGIKRAFFLSIHMASYGLPKQRVPLKSIQAIQVNLLPLLLFLWNTLCR